MIGKRELEKKINFLISTVIAFPAKSNFHDLAGKQPNKYVR